MLRYLVCLFAPISIWSGRWAKKLDRRAKLVDILGILQKLRLEHELLEDFIKAGERYVAGTTRRRGRPPAWMAEAGKKAEEPKRRGRPQGSKNKLKLEATVPTARRVNRRTEEQSPQLLQ